MGAVFSPDRTYRYQLERGEGLFVVLWLMVNPSDADADADDPTVRKVKGFTSRWFGPAKVVIGNKFAHQARDVRDLKWKTSAEAIGPDNDFWLLAMLAEADAVVLAWGPLAKLPNRLRGRWLDVYRMVIKAGHLPLCFGTTGDGQPRHPLTSGYDVEPSFWTRPNG